MRRTMVPWALWTYSGRLPPMRMPLLRSAGHVPPLAKCRIDPAGGRLGGPFLHRVNGRASGKPLGFRRVSGNSSDERRARRAKARALGASIVFMAFSGSVLVGFLARGREVPMGSAGAVPRLRATPRGGARFTLANPVSPGRTLQTVKKGIEMAAGWPASAGAS